MKWEGKRMEWLELVLANPLALLITLVIVGGLGLYIFTIWLPKKIIKTVSKLVIAGVILVWAYISFIL